MRWIWDDDAEPGRVVADDQGNWVGRPILITKDDHVEWNPEDRRPNQCSKSLNYSREEYEAGGTMFCIRRKGHTGTCAADKAIA